MRFRGIEERHGASNVTVFELEGGVVFERFDGGMEGGAALHGGYCGGQLRLLRVHGQWYISEGSMSRWRLPKPV